MAKSRHIDRDVELALELRSQLVDRAVREAKDSRNGEKFVRAFESMRSNRIFVWEPPAMNAFWKFWDNRANQRKFINDYVRTDGLVYRPDMVSAEFHFFPAPGRLFESGLVPPEYAGFAASIFFQPTTRAIGVTSVQVENLLFLPSILETIHADPRKLVPSGHGILVLEPLTVLPPHGTVESSRLMCTLETRFPRIVDGVIVDKKPIAWLINLYQLQIFLVQPFVGHMRSRHRGRRSGARQDQAPPEIVQVLMREPMPSRVPRYLLPRFHPVTGHKLEFEVEVRAHERHCASGVIAQVKAHKRGPAGKSREKVIKVTR